LQRTGALKRTRSLLRPLLRALPLLLLLRNLLAIGLRRKALRAGGARIEQARHDHKTLRPKCNFRHETQPDRKAKQLCRLF
jgi:hypothetical protein